MPICGSEFSKSRCSLHFPHYAPLEAHIVNACVANVNVIQLALAEVHLVDGLKGRRFSYVVIFLVLNPEWRSEQRVGTLRFSRKKGLPCGLDRLLDTYNLPAHIVDA